MLHTLLVAFAIVGGIAAIVFILIFIARRQGQRRNQQLLATYSALLEHHRLQPDFSEIFEHRVLALDTNQRVFIFTQNDEMLPSAIIDLDDIAGCRLWKDGVQISRKRSSRPESVEEYISAVGLSFQRKSGVILNVPVYTEPLDGIEQKIALCKAAEHWLQRLNGILSRRPEHSALLT